MNQILKMPRERRRVAIVTFERGQLLDIAGPLQTFATACELVAGRGDAADPRRIPYDLAVVSAAGGPVRTTSGLVVETLPLAALGRRPVDTVIVAGGGGVHAACGDRRLVRWLVRTAAAARRACAVCTGAFLLAEAGLLAGRRAVTHWEFCDRLQARYPDVRVEADPIYVRDGRIWTSAGITAGIDLALALAADDLGEVAAKRAAQQLVVYHRRPGGQSQFSALLEADRPGSRFSPLLAWARERLGERLPVERLAERAAMSPRHFARAFAAETGMTPAKAVERLRLETSRERIESGSEPIELVAAGTGFGDPERMRRAFIRAFGQPPQALRRAARAGAAG
jgi:transcriptional regulator GlxA family with amidase domain